MHKTNYYDKLLDFIEVSYQYDIEDEEKLFKDANKEEENWVVLVDPDVEHVTLFDKVNKHAYSIGYKGYELLEVNIVGYLKVKYEYIEDYLGLEYDKKTGGYKKGE